MKYSFERKIIPKKLICNTSIYKIIITKPTFIIRNFDIYVNKDEKIEKIIITNGKHPNCNPETKIMCLPDYIKDLEMNNQTLNMIICMIEIFNFNSAYYQPWSVFEYDRRKYEQ